MEDFTILHLSDLHASRKDGTLTGLFKNLLDDIKDQSQYCENIIIVVTGDLIHKGIYMYRESVLEFFRQVDDILTVKIEGEVPERKVKGLYIVPGNHDKRRDPAKEKQQKDLGEEKKQENSEEEKKQENSEEKKEQEPSDREIIRKYHTPIVTSKRKNNPEFYKEHWSHFIDKFSEYTKLVKEIYEIFDLNYLNNELFGVYVQQLNGHNIAFISLNTAWSCLGDKDERNLVLGDFQLNQIWKKYNEKLGEGIDLTIAMGHHPLDWLTGKEETFVREQIMSRNRLNVDVYLSGHIHDRSVVNLQTPGHSLTTLVSGIGWPDDGKTDRQASNAYHNYAWYTFNLDLNSIDVYVRKTNEQGKFEADITFYPDAKSKNQKKMVMPLNANRVLTYFDLTTMTNRSSKAYYISDEILRVMQSYINTMRAIQKAVFIEFEKRRIDIYEQLLHIPKPNPKKVRGQKKENESSLKELFLIGNEGDDCSKQRKNYAEKNCEMMGNAFQGYLFDICNIICDKLNAALTQIDGKEHVMRAHFRWWNANTKRYEQLCTNRSNGVDATKPIQSLEWGELLKESYNRKHPLVASLNRSCCEGSFTRNKAREDAENEWVDFLTAIPNFNGNICIKSTREIDDKEEQPWITFGVTVYDETDRQMLYMMDYFDIGKIIKEFIDEFLYFIPLNIKKFVTTNIRKDNGARIYDGKTKSS